MATQYSTQHVFSAEPIERQDGRGGTYPVCATCGATEDAVIGGHASILPAHVTQTPYDRAIAYATAEGTRAGENAAEWYLQDAPGGGRNWDLGDNTAIAQRIIDGIEDGDPEILDTLPYADLSGEWADTLTGPQLVRDATDSIGIPHAVDETGKRTDCVVCDLETDAFSDICDAYESAFSQASQDTIVARLARQTGDAS